ncbi:MAG TPA: NAD(P)-binding domain-containing protein [Bacteroidales bacterium]|nr:NAD(P)-binding domain-containing protein [Bacteroidales bacterium]
MKTKSLGFLGGGRITRILLQAFANKNADFRAIVIYDTDPEVLKNLNNRFPYIRIAETPLEVASQDIVFIALHPPVIMEMLEGIKDSFNYQTVIISLAPKITIERIIGKIKSTTKIVRSIPNATSFINEGYNPVCFSSGITGNEKQDLLAIFSLLGHTFETIENKLESYAILSAMLPTYFWFQWKALLEIGQLTGLNDPECKESIQLTTISAMNLMFKSGLSPEEVMDLIPVKPIGEHEAEILDCFKGKLLPLFDRIKP